MYNLEMFDTHSHIQFKIFDKTRDQVIENAKKAGVSKIIAVGTNLETSKKAIVVAEKYPEVFASVGIHPHHVYQYLNENVILATQSVAWRRPESSKKNRSWTSQDDIKKIETILSHPKVVAIGETGMDKHIYENTKYSKYQITKEFINLQKFFFEKQIQLAIKYKKALIIHNREAVPETLEVLEKNWDKTLEQKSVFHMCESDERLLNFAVKNNVFISFGGDITYDKKKQEFLKKVPLELLVLETDSPFFTPQHICHSGEHSDSRILNTPANLKLISQKVAEIMKMDVKQVEEQTYENAKKLYSL